MVKDFLVSSILDLILLLYQHLWPKSWPVQKKKKSCQITGISQTKVQEVYQSTQTYPCEGPEGQPATLKPYVIDAPINLIGRDLLMQCKLRYTFHIFPRGHCSFNKQYNY